MRPIYGPHGLFGGFEIPTVHRTGYDGWNLVDVHNDIKVNLQGVSVYELQDDSDTAGKCIYTEISLYKLLTEQPKYQKATVKYSNDFFGMTVLRIEKTEE